tara:strand:- start:337 stop:2529 length:2193 start_codon:yes stop_codon:yes gene_type:complete
MAEYAKESNHYITSDSEDQPEGLLPDTLGLLVQQLYTEASSDTERTTKEEIWESAWHAMRGEFPDVVSKAVEIAKERGIYVNLTKRKVHEARTKLMSATFQQGKIPFKISPSRRPKFMVPEVLQSDSPYDEAILRAKNCELKIRDIMDITNYEDVLSKVINEQTLYGTGVTKSIVLKKIDFPLYQTAYADPLMEMIEEAVEAEMYPHVEWISVWDVFPSSGSTGKSDLDWVIQRRYMSAQELRAMAESSNGALDAELIERCIETGEGQTVSDIGGTSPKRWSTSYDKNKNYCVLELWHRGLGRMELAEHMEVPDQKEGEPPINLPVVVTVLGSKVLRAIPNPFDGRIPYDFCYWQEQEDSIWGSGIYEAIRDDQSMMNFIYGMIVEGKTMSSQPMFAINPNAFDSTQDDFYDVFPGKIFRMKTGESVNDAFRPVLIPDVTSGLVDLLRIVERNTDLSSGQTPIGMGSGAQYQTKTATGMQILNENQNKLTTGVVRSLNALVTANVSAIYYWLMADSDDLSIKGDFLCQAKSFDTFMAKEVTIQQVLQLIQVVGQVPEMRGRFNFEKLAVPLKAGLGLEIDGLIKSEEEAAEDAQQEQQQAVQQAQMQMDLENQNYEDKALVDEKKAVAADIRKGIIQERLAKIKEGDLTLSENLPDLLQQTSLLLLEEMQKQQMEAQQQRQQQEQQAQQQRETELRGEDVQEQQNQGADRQGEAGAPAQPEGRSPMEPAL